MARRPEIRADPRAAPAPWYRHFYVWLLIAFPALSVAGGVATLWLAISTRDGLVEDDYYRHGLQINRDLERDHAAAALDLSARISRGAGSLTITLAGNETFRAPGRLRVSFLHPTRAGFDRSLELERTGPAAYTGPDPQLVPGRWHVLLEAGAWRLMKRLPVN